MNFTLLGMVPRRTNIIGYTNAASAEQESSDAIQSATVELTMYLFALPILGW
jgi:hypothetical protein